MREVFRLAQENDFAEITRIFLDAILKMCEQSIFQWDEVYPDESILKYDIIRRHMYVMTEEERIVSAIVINDEQPEEYRAVIWRYADGKIAVLHRLCVDPAFQNKGYGKKAVMEAEREMKDMGYTAVRLDAFSQNPFALKLYEALGYRRAGEVLFRKGIFLVYEKMLQVDSAVRKTL